MRAAFSFLRLAVLLLAGLVALGAADARAASPADAAEKALPVAGLLATDVPLALAAGGDGDDADPAFAILIRPVAALRPSRAPSPCEGLVLLRSRSAPSAYPRAPPVLF